MYDMGEPLGSNICLVHSTAPTCISLKGHYCPNTTSELVCPVGETPMLSSPLSSPRANCSHS